VANPSNCGATNSGGGPPRSPPSDATIIRAANPSNRGATNSGGGSPRSPPSDAPPISTNPIPVSNLPHENPFLVVAARLRSKKANGEIVQTGRFDTEDTYPLTPSSIQTAGPAKFFDTTVENLHEDDALRTMAAALYVRQHFFSEDDIARFLTAFRNQTHSAKKEGDRKRVMAWQSDFLSAIMKFYHNGLGLLLENTGGIEVWRTSSLKQRTAVFRTLFNSNKFAMSKAALGPCACAVPLGNIFSDTTPLHKKWQKFHQTVFEWTCELIFQNRFSLASDNKMEAYRLWKGLILGEKWDVLNLGGLDEIPVKWGGIADVGRRQTVTVADCEGLELADSDVDEDEEFVGF